MFMVHTHVYNVCIMYYTQATNGVNDINKLLLKIRCNLFDFIIEGSDKDNTWFKIVALKAGPALGILPSAST